MAENNEKIGSHRSMKALNFWQSVLASSLRELPLDLSVRQMAVMLTVYLEAPPHSIKTLGESLNISKPAVCRVVDALEKTRLAKRVRDKGDKRNVLIQRTVKGSVYLSEFADIILSVSKKAA